MPGGVFPPPKTIEFFVLYFSFGLGRTVRRLGVVQVRITHNGEPSMLNNLNLADRYSVLAERLRELEAEVKTVRELILATGQDVVRGDFADVEVKLSERTSFDGKAAQRFLSADQVVACTRQTVVTTLRVRAKVEVA